MFGINDKLSLTLINAKDVNGNILPFQLQLPLNNNKYNLPKELASIDVFEYHEGLVNSGHVVVSLYVGKVTTINKIIDEIAKGNVRIATNLEIASINTPLCIKNNLGKQVVFDVINDHDIVVESQEQLMETIEQLSNNLNIINNSVSKIKKLYKNNDK